MQNFVIIALLMPTFSTFDQVGTWVYGGYVNTHTDGKGHQKYQVNTVTKETRYYSPAQYVSNPRGRFFWIDKTWHN